MLLTGILILLCVIFFLVRRNQELTLQVRRDMEILDDASSQMHGMCVQYQDQTNNLKQQVAGLQFVLMCEGVRKDVWKARALRYGYLITSEDVDTEVSYAQA